MFRTCSLVFVLINFLVSGVAAAQEHAVQYSQADVEAGFNLYNANCITCHGANGDSVPGVNLRGGQFRRVAADADLNRLIQTGIPGTAMPPGRYTTADLAALVAYIRSLREFDTALPGRGNAARGQSIFEEKGNCTNCHRVNGKGSRVAPELSDIGAIRAPGALERSLIDPTASMLPRWRISTAISSGINSRRPAVGVSKSMPPS